MPLPSTRRTQSVLALLLLASVASIVVSVCVGSVWLGPRELWDGVIGQFGNAPAGISSTLVTLRLQRALVALVTGASLSVSGVLMQALLRNPLADPYVLGISGGAAVGALLAMLCCELAWMVGLSALAGSLLVAGLLFMLARRDFRGSGSSEGSATTLLLTGVIVSSGSMALVALLLSISPDSKLRSMVFWMIGDLSVAAPQWLPWLVLATVLGYVCTQARAINVAVLFADSAQTLGVAVGSLRKLLFVCSALLTATAVASAGSIGFVGLIMPHACRYAMGPDHRLLLPASALAGGSFLLLADTVARSVLAPQQLPVGVITALVGVPMFLWQLHRQRTQRGG